MRLSGSQSEVALTGSLKACDMGGNALPSAISEQPVVCVATAAWCSVGFEIRCSCMNDREITKMRMITSCSRMEAKVDVAEGGLARS
jgi:hypothetical protein